MEIEKVAADTPEKILRATIDPAVGLAQFQANQLGWGLGLEGEAHASFVRFVNLLAEAAVDLDSDLIEINPMVVTGSGQVLALDGKMAFDDNALYRHPDIAAMRDENEEEPAETEAKRVGISYIKLDGNIGCMVNGAGLAMSTMDIIKHFGGEPANFLDVGGGASAEQVAAGFRLITQDPSVKAIFVNIFGGILRCDVLAEGIVEAVNRVGLDVPLVVRLEGTNVEQGKAILEQSGLNLVAASDMKDGAEKIVALSR
jgi:succinyl-CoA synthetase beta subunit